jgi:hypothetical protein
MSEAIPGKPIDVKTMGSDLVNLTKNVINGVMNDFTPKILSHFQAIQKNGIQGRIVYTILEELDDDFDTEVSIDDEDMTLAEAIDKIQRKSGHFPTAPKKDKSTSTIQEYNAAIFFEYKDEDMGTMEKNSFERVGRKIVSKIKKLGYTATVTSPGMGRVDITITGKKE